MADDFINFPTLTIEKQLFHVPGAAIDGGFTSGGARIMSPEPGGRSQLELQIALQIFEWDYPETSWLMSKINGTVFRVRLAPTPQVCRAQSLGGPGVPWDNNGPWNNGQNWAGDMTATYLENALEGTTKVKINMSSYGTVLKRGHAIGHGSNCYMVDSILYDPNTTIATITLMPPLRKNVVAGDQVLFRPFFLGTINNGANFRVTYDAGNVGYIQPGQITFMESIV